MKQRDAKSLAICGVMAALIFLFTYVFKIPSPHGGYIHLGDGLILLSGFFLPPVEAILSAAIGASLADLLGGYVLYIPATFVIKALQCALAHILCQSLKKKTPFSSSLPLRFIIASIFPMLVMIFGYFVYEYFFYGWAGAAGAVVGNGFQALGGIIVAAFLYLPLRRILQSI